MALTGEVLTLAAQREDGNEYVPSNIDTANLPKYQWQPLQDKTYRRLLHMHPAPAFDDPIVVSLSQHAPGKIPAYMALSYHWGNPDLKHDIIVLPDMPATESLMTEEVYRHSVSEMQRHKEYGSVQSKRTAIHDNLFSALRRLRSTQDIACVWTDLLCINQGDNEKKNEQVQRMAPVYAEANVVIVYLGEDEVENESLELDCVFERVKLELVNQQSDRIDSVVDFQQFSTRLHQQWDRALAPYGIRSSQQETCGLLKRFFRKPWFQRAWVVQEARPVLEGLQTVFVLGDMLVSWRIMFFAWLLLKNLEPFNEPDKVDFNSPVLQAILSQENKLTELLERSQRLKASDMRDHCFTMLTISEYAHRVEWRPDYGEPPTDTFLRYTKFLISEGYGPEMLSLCVKGPNKCISLPSWAPDWSSPTRRSITTRQVSLYRATGELTGNYEVVNDRVLKVSGVLFDQVQTKRHIDFQAVQGELGSTTPVTDSQRTRTIVLQYIYNVLMEIQNTTVASELTSEGVFRYLLNDVDQSSQRLHTVPSWTSLAVQALRNDQAELLKYIANEVGFEWDKTMIMIVANLAHYQMAMTRKGYLAKVPLNIKDDDIMGLVSGCRCPLVLRRVSGHVETNVEHHQSRQFFEIVGHVYVHGFMDGEALPDLHVDFEDLYLV